MGGESKKAEEEMEHSEEHRKMKKKELFYRKDMREWLGLKVLLEVVHQSHKFTPPSSIHVVCQNSLCQKQFLIPHSESQRFNALCQECIAAKSNNQFCEYCGIIYKENKVDNAWVDGQDWVQCDECNRWNHVECAVGALGISREELDCEDIEYYCKACKEKRIRYKVFLMNK